MIPTQLLLAYPEVSMDDLDFLRALSRGPSKGEAEEFMSELKMAAAGSSMAKELAGKGLKFISEKKAPLLGAAIGAATATALQYLANRPGKEGKPSVQRRSAEGSLAGHQKAMSEMQAKGQQPGFSDEMGLIRSEQGAKISRLAEKHPVRGALLAAPLGAAAGYGLGALAKKIAG